MSEFDLVGNAICLDFSNTVNKRPDHDRDALDSIDAFAAWASMAGLPLSTRVVRGRSAAESSGDLAAARILREAIYRAFSAVAADGDPDQDDLATIAAIYAPALGSAQFARQGSHFHLRWPPPYTVRRITSLAAASAVQLLLGGPLERVGECPSCGWLFVDTSRGGRRRWCSMAVCGSRVKARRYYAASTGRVERD